MHIRSHIEDLNGHHLTKFKDQWGAEVRKGPDEDDNRPGEIPR